jgi:hypothetical protein
MAHVRVCGGAGWGTTGSTRKPTAPSGRVCPCAGRCLGAAAHRGRYCDTRSRASLLDTKERRGDRAWCGATCSRTVGASLVTAGYQARGKPMRHEWHRVSSSGHGWEGEGNGSLDVTHRDAGGARATIRPQRQNGMEGRSVSLNGALTPPLTLPVSRGILTRLGGETRETWEAGFALWGGARRQSPESPARKPGRRRSR